MRISRVYNIIATATYCWLLTCSCSEDIASDLFGQRTPITITASVDAPKMGFTRATTRTKLNDSDGFTLSSTTAYNKVNINIDGDDYVYSITGTAGTQSNILTVDGTQPFFPIGETSVKVFARYPNYSEDLSTTGSTTYFTIQQDQTSTDAYLRSDLMTAAATATRSLQTNGTWNVTEAALEFQHQMTKLMVTAQTEANSGLTIKSVVINGVKPRIPLTVGENGYVVGAATTDGNSLCYDVLVLSGAGEGTVVIPAQTFAPSGGETQCTFMTVTVDYQNEQTGENIEDIPLTYYFTGTGKTFASNQVYTINITLGNDTFELWKANGNKGVDISEWNAADLTAINIYPTVVHTSLTTDAEIVLLNNGTDVTNTGITKTYTGDMITLKEYDGSSVSFANAELAVRIKNGDYIVKTGNYATTYSNNVDCGTATVSVVGIGNTYSGTLQATFSISQRSLANATIADIDEEEYDGYAHEPGVNITDEIATGVSRTLFLGTDYTLEYANNTNAGTATITITGINNYTGTRTKTFSIAKIPGSFVFADTSTEENPLRIYKQTTSGASTTYKNEFVSIVGDGHVTSASSSNTNVADVASDGTVTLKASGTTKITLTISGNNYDYANYSYWLKVKVGPILPIMYVASTNVGDLVNGNHAMADNNWTNLSAFYCWNEDTFGGYNTNTLKRDGITKNGIHYHMPSYSEWLGIVGEPSTWTTTATEGVSDENVKFGVTIPSDVSQRSERYDTDYSYQVANLTCTSDYILVDKSYYALRFKNTNYCCAYRYDYLTTTDANKHLTGNSNGAMSLVIRVIYLGTSTSVSISTIANLNWDEDTDFTVSLPIGGYQNFGSSPGSPIYSSIINGWYGYYNTATSYNEDATAHYDFVVVPEPAATIWHTGYSNVASAGMFVRMFRDAY